MSTLHYFVGIPGSGRKEIAKKLSLETKITYVSSDDIREEMVAEKGEIPNNILFEEIQRRIKKALTKGEDVVFDATNLYSKQRKNLVQMMKGHTLIAHYVCRTLKECLEADKNGEFTLGEDLVIQKFMGAEIPFAEEGWNDVNYWIEPVSVDEVAKYLSLKEEVEIEDEVIAWAKTFMQSGKPVLDSRPEGPFKKMGYNNMSAQIAFQTLYTMNYHIEFIQDVVQLILYRNRIQKANEKGIQKLKNQLGEKLYSKLELLTES